MTLKKGFRRRTNYQENFVKYPRDKMKKAYWFDAKRDKKQRKITSFVKLN